MPELDLRPGFFPQAPVNLETLDLPWPTVVDLTARRLNLDGIATVTSLASKLKLPYSVIEAVFRYFQKEKLVEIRGSDGEGFNLSLTAAGHKFTSDRMKLCQYAGPAPVTLPVYQEAVRAQAARPRVTRDSLRRVFSDMVLENGILDQIGPAMISQKSLFMFGPSGNGKTSLAERLVGAYEDTIVIPYAVEVDGQIICVYDPVVHQAVNWVSYEMDPRWVVCRRPAIVVGGELTSDMLELRLDTGTNIYSAPVQMKANNGLLVIDDFGRQVVAPSLLLNRWILPLDRRIDYLNLRYGLKFQVPFELMLVFATNLEPSALMDPAFLRRLPNKILVGSISDRSFLEVFQQEAVRQGFAYDPVIAGSLLNLCRTMSRDPLRACYPRDICRIVSCINEYEGRPNQLSPAMLERACQLYFGCNGTAAAEAASDTGDSARTMTSHG